MGFVLAILEQRFRYLVFQKRIALTGVQNFLEHYIHNHGSVFLKVARELGVTIPSRPENILSWVDLLSMRLLPTCSRRILKPKNRVFLSYHRSKPDTKSAFEISENFAKHGISHFLDKKNLKEGLPWRSRVAFEISQATHFILLLSENTVGSDTCCAHEVRQALACMPITAWPQIFVCLLDSEEKIRNVGGDPLFTYLLERANRVDINLFLSEADANGWLNSTAPESFFSSFMSMFRH